MLQALTGRLRHEKISLMLHCRAFWDRGSLTAKGLHQGTSMRGSQHSSAFRSYSGISQDIHTLSWVSEVLGLVIVALFSQIFDDGEVGVSSLF